MDLRKHKIIQNMEKIFGNHKLKKKYFDKYETTEERLKCVPKGIDANDWRTFVEWHECESMMV